MEQHRKKDAARKRLEREVETEERALERRRKDAERHRIARENETEEQTQSRRQRDNAWHSSTREAETDKQKEDRRAREAQSRRRKLMAYEKIAMNYDPNTKLSTIKELQIGGMTKVCPLCGAKKWAKETDGFCCGNGKIDPPGIQAPPQPLLELMEGKTTKAKKFLKKIRSFNHAFNMCSFRAKQVKQESGFPGAFKVQGMIYHQMGALEASKEGDEKFLQIYFIGNHEEQTDRRCAIIQDLDREIVRELQEMLHQHNDLINGFKTALEKENLDEDVQIVIRADAKAPGQHKGTMNAPTTNEVAVLLTNEKAGKRDIVLQKKSGDPNSLTLIDSGHRKYDALMYPLILPYGQDGFDKNKKIQTSQKTDTMLQFYKFHLMVREDSTKNHLHRCGELFQMYLVDQFAKIEAERINYIKHHQQELRADQYQRIVDTAGDLRNIGKKVVLPASFTGGPRYMWKKQQDALTYVRKYGHPDLFITKTANPKWEEIQRELGTGQTPTDRPDIVVRVFKQKLTLLLDLILKRQIFGPPTCFMYSIEFQKRGLPHAHMLLWLENPIRPADIDQVISAEIPDKTVDPELYDIVMKTMVHGPCGDLNKKSPCMEQGKCSKKFPKDWMQSTRSDQDGYPQYRRRKIEDGGREAVIVRGEKIYRVDNRYIVPYNSFLTKLFQCHINVELCTSVRAIKYVCKYICKGQDMLAFELKAKNANDETELFQLARYISAPEAAWRIFAFDIHEHSPGVEPLAVHLENQRIITFNPTIETSESIQNRPEKKSTLEGFFELCREDPEARQYLYVDIPEHYIWKNVQGEKKWVKRKTKEKKLGRVYPVHPSNMEAFCMRLLLFKVRGPRSFEDLRTVEMITGDDENGMTIETTVHNSYQEACRQLGLLEDDRQYNQAMIDASFGDSPKKMRDLFSYIITACPDVKDRLTLWNNHKDDMSEDFLYEERKRNPNADYGDVHNKCLISIEDKVLQISGKDLSEFAGLPIPNRSAPRTSIEEKRETYDYEVLNNYVIENQDKLTDEQRMVYDTLMENLDSGGFFFIDAPGGTGKTFLSKLLLADVRRQGHTALAVASSGIAATLLPGGRTAHSTFKLPLDLTSDDMPTCNVTRNSAVATIIKKTRLVLWDECTMSHKRAFEAVNRMMQDVIPSPKQMWKIEGNKLTDKENQWNNTDEWRLIEEDTLFYIKNVTKNKVLTLINGGKVSLQSFTGRMKERQLWSKGKDDHHGFFHLQNADSTTFLTSISPQELEVQERSNEKLFGGALFVLTGDFRQILPVVPGGTKGNELDASVKASPLWEKIKTLNLTTNMRVLLTGEGEDFANTLLEIGNGELGRYTNGIVGFPPNVAVKDKKELIEATFPDFLDNFEDENYIAERAILAPKLNDVEEINAEIIKTLPKGGEKMYLSYNKVVHQVDAQKYPVEFLETLNPSGVPPHRLPLKPHMPIMLMRNLDPPRLCNGTRLKILKLHDNVIEAKIIVGDYKGEEVFLPRIPLIPTGFGFDFKRIQFPVKPCYAMSINKSQGQTLKNVGLYLETEPFAHGQLYVGCSRTGREDGLKIYAPNKKTRNVVYREALQ